MPTIEVMPMTTPSTVNAERILLDRNVSTAMPTISRRIGRSADLPVAYSLRKRFDRVELRRPHRRIEPEEQSDERGNADSHRDRPDLHRGGQGRHFADRQCQGEPEDDANHASQDRERDRLGEDLPDDVAAAGAKRLAQADFPRPLAHDHQHDVHDDDAADDEREGDDADEHGEDAGRHLPVEVEQRLRREHPEVVGLLRPQPPLDAHRRQWHRPSPAARAPACAASPGSAGRTASRTSWRTCRAARSRIRPANFRRPSPFSGDADDPVVEPGNLHRLVERVDRRTACPQCPQPMTVTGRLRSTSVGLDQPPALDVERREVDVVARHAADAGRHRPSRCRS